MSEPTGPHEPVDPTRPMPAAPPAPTQQQPAQPWAAAQPSAAQQPTATQPSAAHQAAAQSGGGVSTGRPNLWRQATSTTGGTIAVVVAGVLTALLVVGVLGMGAVAVARTVYGHGDRMEQVRGGRDGNLPPGQQKRLEKGREQGPGMGNGMGNGMGRGNGNGKGSGSGSDDRLDGSGGPGGLGMGSMMGAAGVLGDVQHGEFTVTDATGKDVVMTVQRGTVTAASATSVSVRSADGFTATYAVDASTRGRAGTVAKGDSVLVVAQKSGSKAVAIRAVRAA